jgi:hypothetical protein
MTKSESLLSKLEAAAAALGVSVSYESITASIGPGGLCKVRGEYRIIVDRRAVEAERVAVIASSLARLDTGELDPILVDPEVARAIDLYALSRAS